MVRKDEQRLASKANPWGHQRTLGACVLGGWIFNGRCFSSANLNCVLQNVYVEALTPNTSECDYILEIGPLKR